ncbi:hypothetical protein [Hahella sp. HN01]|uniref:hypothetical protein n=1 Tax=Hahella sp. HN01 TaxID=2847262 RepID=UPI001C1EE559|nr:hypothetical protein [Hahella sp. HN01]MBU6955796.1 hypothetical protein [Hahella sp. HN01]
MQERNLPDHHQLIPLENPVSRWGLRRKLSGKELLITKEANSFLMNLNDYQKTEIYRAINKIVSEGGYGRGSAGFLLKPMSMRAKQESITAAGNLCLIYSVNSEKIVINSIEIDPSIVGSQSTAKDEVASLYKVPRVSDTRYHEHSSDEDVRALERAWGEPRAQVEVTTEHAAVNGMQNDLRKARWLMGVHLDTAYWDDHPKTYTLFHNPTQGVALDLFECALDRISSSKLSKQLAAVLTDCQRKNRKVKWVCHSQGGIIFVRAVELVNKMGVRLDGQKVAIHAGGNKKKRAEKAFNEAGIEIVELARESPFDFVPHLAGLNNLTKSSRSRCKKFRKLVYEDGHPVQTSPHTLPYLGFECSLRHLQMCGYDDYAEQMIKERDLLS